MKSTRALFLACTLFISARTTLADEPSPDAELAAIRQHFADRPRQDSIVALKQLSTKWPESTSAGYALAWLGDLALHDGKARDAKDYFADLEQRFPHGELHALACRGLGSVALEESHWSDAIVFLDQALRNAPPALAAEVAEKRRLALRERGRFVVEIAAWSVLLVALVYFARRVYPWPKGIRLPFITRCLAPVFALFILAGWGRDPGVWRALLYLGTGSLILITVAFAPSVRPRGSHAIIDGIILTSANSAILYLALRHAKILDVLWETVRAGADTG